MLCTEEGGGPKKQRAHLPLCRGATAGGGGGLPQSWPRTRATGTERQQTIRASDAWHTGQEGPGSPPLASDLQEKANTYGLQSSPWLPGRPHHGHVPGDSAEQGGAEPLSHGGGRLTPSSETAPRIPALPSPHFLGPPLLPRKLPNYFGDPAGLPDSPWGLSTVEGAGGGGGGGSRGEVGRALPGPRPGLRPEGLPVSGTGAGSQLPLGRGQARRRQVGWKGSRI